MTGTYREYIKELEENKRVKYVKKEVSKDTKISKILYEHQNISVFFEKIEGFSNSNVIGNFCSTRKDLSLALKETEEHLVDTIAQAFLNPRTPDNISTVSPWIEKEINLDKLPVPRYHENDGGCYFTSSIIVSKFPNSNEENLSIHRIMVLDKKKAVVRILPRHLNRILEEQGGRAEIAVLVGVHPAIFLAAALSASYELSEYKIANALVGGKMELVKLENGIKIPKGTEVVLLGNIDANEKAKEGPFVDITGTSDIIREEPVIHFRKMLTPSDKIIFQALLPASKEHKLFMGLPQELKIMLNLKKTGLNIYKINLTEGGCSYLHCVVSIRKNREDDGKKAIREIFNSAHSIKLAIVVDNDIDPYDNDMVEWAVATRFQADRSLEVFQNQRGSSLDPSSFKRGITAKMGIDATLPLNVDKKKFEKVRIP